MATYSVWPVWLWLRPAHRPPLAILLTQFPSALLFYFAFIWLSPLPWQWDGHPGQPPEPRRRALMAFLAAEAVAVGFVWLDGAVGSLAGNPPNRFPVYLMNLCFQGPALFLVGGLVAYQERLEWERHELRRASEEAQDKGLRWQLHPHVLFNSLNGLAELLEHDPTQASHLVEAMSSFLKRTLEASKRLAWSLKVERSLVEDYLWMEGLRFDERLRVRWQWDPELESIQLLPMLLQPLVENALKHGISPEEEGGDLEIRATADQGHLALLVRNTGRPPGPNPQGTSIGLANLRARLDLAYGANAAFSLTRQGPWTHAEIRLKLSALEHDHDPIPRSAGG